MAVSRRTSSDSSGCSVVRAGGVSTTAVAVTLERAWLLRGSLPRTCASALALLFVCCTRQCAWGALSSAPAIGLLTRAAAQGRHTVLFKQNFAAGNLSWHQGLGTLYDSSTQHPTSQKQHRIYKRTPLRDHRQRQVRHAADDAPGARASGAVARKEHQQARVAAGPADGVCTPAR